MKNKIILTSIALSLIASNSFAQAQLKVVSTNYGKAFGTIANTENAYSTQKALNSMLQGTTNALSRMGNATTSAVSSIARSNITKQILVAGVGLAKFTVLSAVASVAVGTLLSWNSGKSSIASNPDGSATLTNTSGSSSPLGALTAGTTGWKASSNTGLTSSYSSDPATFIPYVIQSYNKNVSPDNVYYYVSNLQNCSTNGDTYSCYQLVYADGHTANTNIWLASQDVIPQSCPAGYFLNNGTCSIDPNATPQQLSQTLSYNDIMSKMTDDDLNSPVSASDLSNMTNALIQTGNNAGLQNLPMTTPEDFANVNVQVKDLVNPTTATEVQSSLKTPVGTTTNAGTSSSPTTSTTTTTDANGNTKTEVNVNATVDLGPDPGIEAPVLNDTSLDFNPITNVVSGFTNIVITGPSGTCFSPSFTVLNHTYNFDFLCHLLSSNEGLIRAITFFGYTIMGILIILSA